MVGSSKGKNKEPKTNTPELQIGTASLTDLATAERGMRAMLNTAEGLQYWAKALHLQDIRSFMEASPEFKKTLEEASREFPPLEYLAKWACWGRLGKKRESPVKWIACHACKIRLCDDCAHFMGILMYECRNTNVYNTYVDTQYLYGRLCKACYGKKLTAPELAARHKATWGDEDTAKTYTERGLKLNDHFYVPFCF